ncbi:MAG TPA: threonine/serine exporter [Oribacterium sp.]|jgi:uncharacterized membrane protein YjjB (DUF3815 family)|nr:threonine/serine exporter [Oribacterium sp.]
MIQPLTQLITAFIGSFGFAMLFQLRNDLIIPSSFGGLLTWGVYLLTYNYTHEIFFSSIVSSAFGEIYAELSARYWKVPATLFFIPAVIPMIPGSTLYYTMSAIVRNELDSAHFYAMQTAYYAIGISIGISAVWAVLKMKKNIEALHHKSHRI